MVVERGEIYYADLNPVVGSEQGGMRPVLVIQNDIGNKHSPTVIVAAVTSRTNKARLPMHVEFKAQDCGLKRDSVVLCEQISTIDKQRLRDRIGHANPRDMLRVTAALRVSLGMSAGKAAVENITKDEHKTRISKKADPR